MIWSGELEDWSRGTYHSGMNDEIFREKKMGGKGRENLDGKCVDI
jgi:hypothetical protein